MKELVVISGKGGTGKTSIVASFGTLAKSKVLVDCDVDAADLHIILEPKVQYKEDFSGGKIASIRPDDCTSCGLCAQLCRYDAVSIDEETNIGKYAINKLSCEGCGVCVWFCPEKAIDFTDTVNGEWYTSNTRFGTLVHARLGIAEENSGKLVSVVRQRAKKIARDENLDYVIIDGAPGIGCPVIASITATNLVLIVTEPTLSGLHDMERVAQLAKHFKIPVVVSINKWDINPDISDKLETLAHDKGIKCVGKIRYDKAFTQAQIEKKSVIEYTATDVADDIKKLWQNIINELK